MSHSQLQVLSQLTVQSFSVIISWVVEKVCYEQCSLDKTLLLFALFILYSMVKLACYSRYLLTSQFCISVPMMKRISFLGCQFQKVLQVFIEPFNFSFFSITGWGTDLDYCDTEWFALEMNRDHSVIFQIAFKYCISDTLVDYEGYAISSKDFLPRIVDIMVISVKFTHSSPFQFTDS